MSYSALAELILQGEEVPTGTLLIDTSPIKGNIYVDGEWVGLAPLTVSVTFGTHTISFGSIFGYKTPTDVVADVIGDEEIVVAVIYEPTIILPEVSNWLLVGLGIAGVGLLAWILVPTRRG